MSRGKSQLHCKFVVSKGKEYAYFDTGQVNAKGKKIYAPLPPRSDLKKFGAAYAAHLAHRTRRENTPAGLSLHDFIDQYQKSREFRALKPSTQSRYDIYLHRLDAAFNTAPANELENTDLVSLLDSMAATPGAANLLLWVTGALFKWGRGPTRKLVTNDPCVGIKPMEVGEHEPWDEDLLADALKSNDLRVQLPTALLYFTGQRIGDVCSMKWSQVKDGYVSVVQEKTDIPLVIKLHRDLKRLLDHTPRLDDFIITGRKGKPIGKQTVRNRLQEFAKLRGHEIVPHGLRKNAVNTLLEVGCTTAQVSSVTGQSLQTIEHYAKRRSGKRISTAAMGHWEGAGA